jgi:hypothetical protein
MVTVLTERGEAQVGGRSEGEALWLSGADAERATGWVLKPEGFCLGEICVPLPRGRESEFSNGGEVNIAGFWRHMNRPALHSAKGDVWMLGESAADRGAALANLEAPDFTLPDLQGVSHSLSETRGKKVFLTTWASW